MDFHLQTYYPILIYLAVILVFALSALIVPSLIAPRKKTPVKEMTYESGVDPIGDARQRFDVKFYLIAILFLVFDVELLFLYPWAVAAYKKPDVAATASADVGAALPRLAEGIPESMRGVVFWEVIVFLGTLVVAYVYAWRRGVFQWR